VRGLKRSRQALLKTDDGGASRKSKGIGISKTRKNRSISHYSRSIWRELSAAMGEKVEETSKKGKQRRRVTLRGRSALIYLRTVRDVCEKRSDRPGTKPLLEAGQKERPLLWISQIPYRFLSVSWPHLRKRGELGEGEKKDFRGRGVG